MPVSNFTDGLEPDDPEATIWRFMEVAKFRDLIETSTLYFNRADLFGKDKDGGDELEGLPPNEYIHYLGLNPLDIVQRREIDNLMGTLAQDRQTFFINCWYLGPDDKPDMWKRRSTPHEAVAITSRYSLLKAALNQLDDS